MVEYLLSPIELEVVELHFPPVLRYSTSQPPQTSGIKASFSLVLNNLPNFTPISVEAVTSTPSPEEEDDNDEESEHE